MERLRSLPAPALYAVADFLDEIATQARTFAELKDRRAGRRAMAARKAALLNAAQTVEHYATHMDLERAIAMVAQQTNLPLETVAFNVNQARRKRADLDRFERDRRILRLARAGYTNKEIGEKNGLHPGTVGKIVRAAVHTGVYRVARTPEKPLESVSSHLRRSSVKSPMKIAPECVQAV